MKIAGHSVTPTEVGLVSLGVGGAILLFAPPGQLAPNPWGWQGPAQEVPVSRAPGFPNTSAGHIGFVQWFVPTVQRHGLSLNSAILFTAHVGRETTYGYNVYNFNFGNIKLGTSKPRGPWMWLTDRRGFHDKYRAYLNADDGIEDDIRLIRDLKMYQKAWQMLLAGDPNWYGQLGLSGYYEGPPDPNRPGVHTRHTSKTIVPVQNEYDGIVSLVRRYLDSSATPAPPTNPSPPSEIAARPVQSPVAGAPAYKKLSPLQIAGGAIALGGGAYWAYSELKNAWT